MVFISMNRILNKERINKASTLLLVFSVFVLLFSLLKLFLPLSGEEKSVVQKSDMPFKNYKPSKLFALKSELPKAEQKVEIEVYKLDNLELKAIVAQENGDGWAVLVDKTNPNKSEFLKKDDEYKGYRLVELKESEAIFLRDGKKYSVIMKKPEFKGIQESSLSIPLATNKFDDKDVIRSIPRREVAKYRANYSEIWKNIAIKEVVKDGKIEGFKINRIKEGSIFEQLGLKVGDLIVAVNNKKLESYADAFKIYNDIEKYESLKFTILRDNQEREIVYEVF